MLVVEGLRQDVQAAVVTSNPVRRRNRVRQGHLTSTILDLVNEKWRARRGHLRGSWGGIQKVPRIFRRTQDNGRGGGRGAWARSAATFLKFRQEIAKRPPFTEHRR